MKPIHIRGISEATLTDLKRRAARHRRFMQKEIQLLLEEAAQMQMAEENEPQGLNLHIVHTSSSDKWDREDIYGDAGR